jgi:hypothetical protein
MKKLTRGVAAAMLVLGMAVAAPALAASAPTATTGGASAVTVSSAVVNATVNPNGSSTTYAFQYGTSTNYGSQTATTATGSGTSSVSVHATLSGLVSGTTYHFRVVATNSTGTASGTDAMFTTTSMPPTATTGSPSLVTSSSAELNATVNPNGKATTYAVQYGPTTSYGLQSATVSAGSGTTSVAVHVTLSGLLSGTTYHYRVIATSSDGTAASADATFVTTGHRVSPTGTLPVVSEAGAVNVSTHSVQLNGAINPEGPTTTWYFQYGLTTYYGVQTASQTISGLGARAINAQLGGLQSGTTYHFRLVAYSANGLYVGPDHTFNTKQGARLHPRGLAVNAYSRRSSSRVTITVYGRLQGLPAGITPKAGCNGTVAIEVRRGNATIGLQRANLRADCTYSLHVYIATSRLHGSTTLGVFARFSGNAVLLPASSRRTVRI